MGLTAALSTVGWLNGPHFFSQCLSPTPPTLYQSWASTLGWLVLAPQTQGVAFGNPRVGSQDEFRFLTTGARLWLPTVPQWVVPSAIPQPSLSILIVTPSKTWNFPHLLGPPEGDGGAPCLATAVWGLPPLAAGAGVGVAPPSGKGPLVSTRNPCLNPTEGLGLLPLQSRADSSKARSPSRGLQTAVARKQAARASRGPQQGRGSVGPLCCGWGRPFTRPRSSP